MTCIDWKRDPTDIRGATILETETSLRLKRPIAGTRGIRDVVEALHLGVDRLFADMKYMADAAADRHRPAIAAVGFPVRTDHWCR